MHKKFLNLLFVSMLGLASCTTEVDDTVLNGATDADGEKQAVEFALSRSTVTEFQNAGIDNLTVLIFKVERKGTSFYAEQNVSIENSSFRLDLPLGETYQAVAVANAAAINGKDALANLTLVLDPAAEQPVWLSAVERFASDKSVSAVTFTLQRVVARVEFAPVETEAELAAQDYFDAINVNVTSVADTYNVASATAEVKTFDFRTDASKGYKVGFYTFDCSKAEEDVLVDLTFYKGGQQVNNTPGALETAVKFAANNRYSITVPVLSNDFVAAPWSTPEAVSARSASFNVYVSPLQ